ncbi:MAG: alkaline phosphatase family protein [Chthoniobacterales bacterium]
MIASIRRGGLLFFSSAFLLTAPITAHAKAEHIVLVVWDGMRPDFVTEANAPTLWALAHAGVTFRRHHSVYPSLTNVNSTVFATGVLPNRSGLLANYEYRPALDPLKFIRTDNPSVTTKGDQLSGGHYLEVPTIAETIRAAGGRTAIAGGKTTTLLHDRNAIGDSVVLFSGETLPASALVPIEKLLGPFPDRSHVPGAAGDRWTTRALTEVLWQKDVPRYSVLWLSEPDRSQHASGPGSKAALDGIKSSDENLALLLYALDAKGVREKTDVFVVSDHGFSTIESAIDLRDRLASAGFEVLAESEASEKNGTLRVVSNGGLALFYITGHDAVVSKRLAEWLQQTDFAGVLFSRREIEGTFGLDRLHLDTANAPDVMMSFRWKDQRTENGNPGIIFSMKTADPVVGTHGTLSKFDLHNLLIAAGPDFSRGTTDELPTSNLDLVPTMAHLLGLTIPGRLDGRILSEALPNESKKLPLVKKETVETTRTFPGGVWRQYLQLSKIGPEVYVDEGNGELRPK